MILALLPLSAAAQTCDVQTSPYLSRVLQRVGVALEEQRQQDALQILLKASEWVGEHSHHSLEFHLGVQLVEAGRGPQALPHFRFATVLCPSFAPAWQNLGRTAFDAQHYQEAAKALGKAFQLTEMKRADLRYFQALALYKSEDWTGSFELATELFERFPAQVQLDWIELVAATASHCGKRAEAISLLTGQNDRFEGAERFKRVLLSLLLQEQRYESALVQLKGLDYLAELTDAELMTLGDLFRMQSLPLDAARCYHRLANRGQDSAALLRKETESLMAAYKPRQALKVLETGVDRWDSGPLWRLAAQLRLEAEQLPGALQAFTKVLEFSPEDSEAQMMVGYILFLQDKSDAALPWLDKAADSQPQAVTLRDYIIATQESQKKG